MMAKIQYEFETPFGGKLTRQDVDLYLHLNLWAEINVYPEDERSGSMSFQDDKWTEINNITDRVFDRAVLRFIDEPPEGDVRLGTYVVPGEYRNAFRDRILGIGGAEMMEIIDLKMDHYALVQTMRSEPLSNPKEIVEKFMVEMGAGKKKFKLVSEWLKFLKSHVSTPDGSPQYQFLYRYIFNARQSAVTDHHESLAAFIRSRSTLFSNLEPIELVWRAS